MMVMLRVSRPPAWYGYDTGGGHECAHRDTAGIREDPDSYVRKKGSTEFLDYIKENKKDLILFKTALFAEEAKSDPVKKADMIRDIVQSISRIPDMIQRSVYVQQCSQKMQMAEQILIAEVDKMRRSARQRPDQRGYSPAGRGAGHGRKCCGASG
jgi:DNA primase